MHVFAHRKFSHWVESLREALYDYEYSDWFAEIVITSILKLFKAAYFDFAIVNGSAMTWQEQKNWV